jgi:hypothetical protein
VYDPIIVEDSSITQNDLREILRSSKRTGDFVCLVAEKKEILGDILKQHNHISAALTNVDADNVRSNQDSTFKTRFEGLLIYVIPRTMIRGLVIVPTTIV